MRILICLFITIVKNVVSKDSLFRLKDVKLGLKHHDLILEIIGFLLFEDFARLLFLQSRKLC